jgi:hypothetical protein
MLAELREAGADPAATPPLHSLLERKIFSLPEKVNPDRLYRFQIKAEIKAARIEVTEPLTRLLATLSRRKRVNLPPGER